MVPREFARVADQSAFGSFSSRVKLRVGGKGPSAFT